MIIEDDAIRPDSPEAGDQSRAVASAGPARRKLVLHRRIGAVHLQEHLPAAAVSLLPVHRPCRQPAQHGARLGADALRPTREPVALPRRPSLSRPARARTPAGPAARSAPQRLPFASLIRARSSSTVRVGRPSTATMTSPARSPALAAGPVACCTSRPPSLCSVRASSPVSGRTATPSLPFGAASSLGACATRSFDRSPTVMSSDFSARSRQTFSATFVPGPRAGHGGRQVARHRRSACRRTRRQRRLPSIRPCSPASRARPC